MTRRVFTCIFALAALVNILPMLLMTVGGDAFFHYPMLSCFARQFWQGDLYPRWCMDANAGLGTPSLLFYFPLSYFAFALVYPLHVWLSVEQLHALSLYAATCITGFTCYWWLKDIVSPGRALLAALLFIFLPYRMEAMLFRDAYSEVWCIAFLPLFFKYLRCMVRGEAGALPLLAVSCALLMLTNIPCAAMAFIAGGVYLLGVYWRALCRYGAALAWGGAMAAFYLVPAAYYHQYIAPTAEENAHVWANSYLSMHNFAKNGQALVVVTIGVSIFVLALLACVLLWRRVRVDDGFVQREIVAWAMVSAAALFLLLPVSAPFYALIGPLAELVLPWRMQGAFILALAFFAAVWMQWFTSTKRMKTWRGDYSLLLALLVLMSYLVTGEHMGDYERLLSNTLRATAVTQPEYRTRWTDEEHYGQNYVFARQDHRDTIPKIEIMSGSGDVRVTHWAWDGIEVQIHYATAMTVRLDHTYFPVWEAQADDGSALALYPQQKTGQMLLDIPAGVHHVTLHYNIWRASAWLIGFSCMLSILSWLCVIVLTIHWRRARHWQVKKL